MALSLCVCVGGMCRGDKKKKKGDNKAICGQAMCIVVT